MVYQEGLRSSTLRWEKLSQLGCSYGCFLVRKEEVVVGLTIDDNYVTTTNLEAPGAKNKFEANERAMDYLFRALSTEEFER
jgi:hypothetical protein